MPLVSVLTTSYNRADFISEAIESVLASTFEDFEYIIVDDRSTDDTYEIAKAYQTRDQRVRVYQNEKNLGDYPNRNQAASYAAGTYLKYLDSDDIMYPHCLDVMVRCMQKYPNAGLGLCAFSDVNAPFPSVETPRSGYLKNFMEIDLFGRAPGSAIIRRDAFDAVGGFTGKRQIGDHELWLMIARQYDVVRMPRDLVWDRQHEQKESLYDDAFKKAAMHLEIVVNAIMANDCPLTTSEKRAVGDQLRSSYNKQFIRELIRGRIKNAMLARKMVKMTRPLTRNAE
ncbi:glycosyltransferase family 2 protein [Neorhodopirellula pilleata]|uniref:Putative glycosyltransferase EpsE n=1 Tax=Neorhodopirellula pilleata TaxID=2714738 RepID=A0A5C6AAC9_9BACT|nr:glycosyltransferase family A protein [Neorhodopirellula pilleata]TWT96268.1 putative glycosyltransferase EpsE [Neorhodopirellula pilleata]